MYVPGPGNPDLSIGFQFNFTHHADAGQILEIPQNMWKYYAALNCYNLNKSSVQSLKYTNS